MQDQENQTAATEPMKPISIVPLALPITTTKAQPDLPDHAPKFALVKHPLRFGVHGKKHMVAPLKELITADANIPKHWRDTLHAHLDELKSNAAELDLHIVDHPDGGISFQGHIKPIHLG